MPTSHYKKRVRYCLLGLATTLILLLEGCGNYGPLYYPEDAALHQHPHHHSEAPTTASDSKKTEDYQNLDSMTIDDVVKQEQSNDNT